MENVVQMTEEQKMLAIIENQADITGWHIGLNSTMKAMIIACMEIYADSRISQLEAEYSKLREALNGIKVVHDSKDHVKSNVQSWESIAYGMYKTAEKALKQK